MLTQIVKSHPLADGNKRTAIILTDTFVGINGAKIIEKVSEKVLKKKVSLNQKDINKVSTSDACVYNRASEGGPSPYQCLLMIEDIKKKVFQLEKQIIKKENKIKSALKKITLSAII